MATRTIGDIQTGNGKISTDDSINLIKADARDGGEVVEKNELNELGQKIFLDRYAVKDAKKRTLAVGDLVIVIVDDKSGQREIGTVVAYDPLASGGAGRVRVELKDGVVVERLTEHVAKPIETAPEQMMERVARGIAAIEGEKADEWYDKFRWLLNGWKFVPAGRILTAAGTDQQLTFYNCMPPEQEILTADGYKPIAEVNVGDLVVTHRNRLRRVLHKFERETAEPIYIIRAKKLGYDDLRVTGEHKVLAIRSEWVNTHKSRDGLKLPQEAQWIPAKELKLGDFLAAAYNGEQDGIKPIYVSEYISGYQINNGKLFKSQQRSDYHGYLEEGGTKYSVNDRLIVDPELCYLFGRWLGDGCVTHRTKTDIPSGIKIVFGLDESEEAENIARIIEEKFGIPTSIKMSSTGRWIDLWANSMPLGQFFKAFFGCYSYGKRIPVNLMRMPNEYILALLKGLFTADGYISDNKLGILLSNRTLATQVHQMLMRLGYFFSIKENTHRLGQRPAYRIQATSNECIELFKDFFGREAPPRADIDLKYYFEHDNLRWVRLNEIAIENYSGVVFDLEVEKDHSFVSAGLVVSNCYVVPSPKDSRIGIVDTLSQMMEIMSRGGGVGINVSSLRPRHSYVKGVNGRSSGSVSWGALYSFVTGLIEQGGCLSPDTLVFTESGLLRLDEIVTHPETGWREQRLMVMTDEGNRLSRQVFNHGVAEVLSVETDAGIRITGTPNHKVKVMTDAGVMWRRLDELQCNEAILVKLGQHTGKLQTLQKPEYRHHNQDVVELPDVLDEDLAFFLGYLAGDGFMTSRNGDWRPGVAVSHSSYLIDEMPAQIQRLFKGVNLRVQQKEHDASLIYLISNRAVKEFLQQNGFDKRKSTEVCVPRLIRQSPPAVVGAFLRGLFEADGGISHGYPMLTSASKRLIDEVATLLIGLGCPVKIESQPLGENHFGKNPLWRLRIHSFRGLESWKTAIGCDRRSRFAACTIFTPDLTREVSYRLPNVEYWLDPVLTATTLPQIDPKATGQRLAATDTALRRKLLRYQRSERNLTLSAYATLSESHTAFAENAPPINDTWFVYLDKVEKAGKSLTLDLEVDENHTYLANGLVTHNSRRGALMLILNCWHPDVMEFINAKRDMGKINNANVSVGITDKFMEAVHADADWDLVFPDPSTPDYERTWDGNLDKWLAAGKPVITYKTVKARDIWNAIIDSAWSSAEPGVFFIDRANKDSNSWYYDAGYLACTNPCGEQPIPGWAVCNLGAINLAKFVHKGEVSWEELGKAVHYAVRFLDNVIDATPYFFQENYQQQKNERRVGLNTMGLAEMMIRLGIRYGSEESSRFIDRLYRFIASNAYEASADIAVEKGAFPEFDTDKFLQSGYMQRMPEDIRETVREKGIRNVTLLTQAPNGTIGTMVGTSTGIEPFYFWSYLRKSRLGQHEERVKVLEEWQQAHPGEPLPNYFVTAMDLTPKEHVQVQAAIQRWVDSAISKTCNLPNSYTVEQTRELYELMYRLGCKGGTIYRDGSRDVQVLNLKKEDKKVTEKTPAQETKAAELPSVESGGPENQPVVSESPATVATQPALFAQHEVSARPKIRPRPYKRRGYTVSKNTPTGTAHITMNEDEEGQPFEVFLEIGKAGSDIKAMAEAMGRLMSLLLRIESPVSPTERVQEIVKQITGIGGARSYGFGKRRVLSLPDAVGQALAENYLGVTSGTEEDNQGSEMGLDGPMLKALEGGSDAEAAATSEITRKLIAKAASGAPADICPNCGDSTFIRVEGCQTCYACGYSEC